MSTSSVDLDMDDTDDAVALVREPPSRMSFPSYSGLLKPSATASAKRPARGIPISMPTTQRRESNFSFFTPNAALVTGSREGGSPKRPVFGAQMISHTIESHRLAHSLGSLESRKKQKQTEVVLLSDEDDMKDRTCSYRRVAWLHGSGFSTSIKITLSHCDSSGIAKLRTEFDLNKARIAINEDRIAINKVRIGFNKSSNTSDETKCNFRKDDVDVRVGTKIDIKRQMMMVQLGPDRFIINIDKNATKIPHHTVRAVGYYIEGETKLIVLNTSEKLDPESILAPYYDPSPLSGKGRRLVLYTTSEKPNIEEYCDRLASKGCSTHKLTSESAGRYLEELRSVRSSVEPPSAGTNVVVPHIPVNPGDIEPRQTTVKTRSIAVHIEDLARLFESDFLNDILIEFGLKYIYEGLEKRNPELAKRTYIFNSFFYQRLIDKPAAGMSSYDAVKSWTNKIDLFAMDSIVVPICEKAHWYLAIITNPGLLLKEDSDDQSRTNSNESSNAASPIPSPARDSTSGSPADSPVFPSVTESMDSLAGSTKDLLRIKGEHGIDQDAPERTESATGRPKRVLRSTVPVDVKAK
ncbi:hypothetical protein EC957_006820 [Mortierella hygrophila]|uniref:Ubiquitin-like protease family profile domain-containing protein n=1 Tax=Mortierella hygrophila TaxID=979708 RepID=A0A9P6K6A7_9FUNG|nr:hypothetical protein EC957_006820 [Mortierella hygrophila]